MVINASMAQNPKKIPIVLLMGPTASGKTAIAVELAKHLPCEIISVDSALVYKGMDIGTAKPDAATLRRVPHHLIDICDPSDAYSAAQFRTDASHLIDAIINRARIPILVGGTMLYFSALLRGLSPLPSADPIIRQNIMAEAQQQGWPALHHKLKHIDPMAAARIHPNDPQRIQRALEVFEISGRPMTFWWEQQAKQAFAYPTLKYIIAPSNRQILHDRIACRFDEMLEKGLIKEIRRFYVREDLHLGLPSMRAVGYRQVWEYLAGKTDFAIMRSRAIVATRQLAKRQLTRLRAEKDVTWYHSKQKLLHWILKSFENVPK